MPGRLLSALLRQCSRRGEADGASVAVAVLAIAASSFWVFVVAYFSYICTDPFAGILFLPVMVVGLILYGVVVLLVATRLLYWPLLCFGPVACGLHLDLPERPDGIWVMVHARDGESFFFVPEGARNIKREEPSPGRAASFRLEYYSPMGVEELMAFYTNRINQAGLTLFDYRREDTRSRNGYYWPSYTLYYRDRCGVWCCARKSAHLPYRDDHLCLVHLDCGFPEGFLTPPGVSF